MIKPVITSKISKNNVSFKCAVTNSNVFNSLEKESQEKLGYVADNINKLFPLNDVYFHKNVNGKIYYKIQKAHPMVIFAHPEVLPFLVNYFGNVDNVLAYMNDAIKLDISHKKLLGKKELAFDGYIDNINKDDKGNILSKLIEEISNFNIKYREKNPES